jgi:hypothetical protein
MHPLLSFIMRVRESFLGARRIRGKNRGRRRRGVRPEWPGIEAAIGDPLEITPHRYTTKSVPRLFFAAVLKVASPEPRARCQCGVLGQHRGAA